MSRTKRFFTGFAAVLLTLIVGFAIVGTAIPNWGATPDETRLALPGDGIVPLTDMTWNHAITINATPAEIYPWLAQIGDTRGGYYSYTFIENAIQSTSGSSDRYANANRIHPEWQTPPQGQGIILNFIAIQDYQPNQYVLAAATGEIPGFEWTWLWYLQPIDTQHTRLIVRHRINMPPDMSPALGNLIWSTGFVMERRMMLGIQERAEGNIPPAFIESLEIGLWLVALLCGLVAAVLFVAKGKSNLPLYFGLLAVVTLFVFIYIQPAIWLRFLIDLLLIGGVVWLIKPFAIQTRSAAPAVSAC